MVDWVISSLTRIRTSCAPGGGHDARGFVTAVAGDVEETEPDNLEAITNAIKQVGIDAGSTLVGVAAADAFNEYVPVGHRPEDFLPGAQSVVVCASLGPTNAAWQSPSRRLMEITGYDF